MTVLQYVQGIVKQDMLVVYRVIDIHGLRNLRVFYKPVFMNQDIVVRDIKSLHWTETIAKDVLLFIMHLY